MGGGFTSCTGFFSSFLYSNEPWRWIYAEIYGTHPVTAELEFEDGAAQKTRNVRLMRLVCEDVPQSNLQLYVMFKNFQNTTWIQLVSLLFSAFSAAQALVFWLGSSMTHTWSLHICPLHVVLAKVLPTCFLPTVRLVVCGLAWGGYAFVPLGGEFLFILFCRHFLLPHRDNSDPEGYFNPCSWMSWVMHVLIFGCIDVLGSCATNPRTVWSSCSVFPYSHDGFFVFLYCLAFLCSIIFSILCLYLFSFSFTSFSFALSFDRSGMGMEFVGILLDRIREQSPPNGQHS